MARSAAAPSHDTVVVLTTAGSEEQAVRIAESLVEGRLAACVNILPGLRSIYLWKNRVWDDQELLLLIKTRASAFDKVRERVRSLHSYELPEVIALPVAAGDADVLDWIRRTGTAGEGPGAGG